MDELDVIPTIELLTELRKRFSMEGGCSLFATKVPGKKQGSFDFRIVFGPTEIEALGLIEASRFQINVQLASQMQPKEF